MSLMNPTKLGRYDLIRVLGTGAMGLVYEARDPNLGRRVAIKTIRVENLSEEAAAKYELRFRTEARSAARLQHPNIVSVYDSGRDGDTAFLVMEFIEGDDLKYHLDKGDRYTLKQTLGIMGNLLSALDYAHRHGIVHRDIKPANLLIEPGGRVKLTDFGVARIQDSDDATRTQGTMVGTLKYMSPEQVRGQPIDARADLFAAGVVLYQLLTGKRPFDGDTEFAIIQQIVGHAPAPPTSFNSRLPPAIDAVMGRALVKSRDQRFATAQEFATVLRAAGQEAADPTVAPPAGPGSPGGGSTWTATLEGSEFPMAMQSGSNAGGSTVAQELELVYWKDIKESTDVEDIQLFLAKFPSGIYAALARRRLRKLGVLAGEDSDTGTPAGAATQLDKTVVMRLSAIQLDQTMLMPLSDTQLDQTVFMSRADAAGTVGAAPAHAAMVPAPDPATELLADPPENAATGQRPVPPSRAVPEASGATGAAVAGPESVPRPSEPARPSKSDRLPAPAFGRWAWSLAGIVVLAGAGLGFNLSSGSGLPPAGPVPAPAGDPAATLSVAPAPPAVVKTAAAPVPATAASGSVAVAPSALKAAATLTEAKKSVNNKGGRVKPAQANVAGSAAPAPTANPRATPDLPRVAAAGPEQACEGRILLGFHICMAAQCAKPAFSAHPVCVERHAMEQQRRDAGQQFR